MDLPSPPRVTLVQHGHVYTPEDAGETDVLILDGRVAKLERVDAATLAATGLDCQVIDAGGCAVVPGLVDPHEHLLGAGGEQGYASRQPPVEADRLLLAGVTTVAGCLGTDGVTRQLLGLLGKVRELQARGVSAVMYTGGFHYPPTTLTGSLANDVIAIDAVIGAGEFAIADHRASRLTLDELSRYATEVYAAGTVSGKAGVMHFHVGPGSSRLALLQRLLDEDEVPPRTLYPTHINRSPELLREAVALASRGCFVDIDTVDNAAVEWALSYQDLGGAPDKLTISSDAQTTGGRPEHLLDTLRCLVQEHALPLERVLSYFTANPAAALRLPSKGRLAPGSAGDLLVLQRDSLQVAHVLSAGRWLVSDGCVTPAGS